MKGIFGPYVVWLFDKKLIFQLVTRIRTPDYAISKWEIEVWQDIVKKLWFSLDAQLAQKIIKVSMLSVSKSLWSLDVVNFLDKLI